MTEDEFYLLHESRKHAALLTADIEGWKKQAVKCFEVVPNSFKCEW